MPIQDDELEMMTPPEYQPMYVQPGVVMQSQSGVTPEAAAILKKLLAKQSEGLDAEKGYVQTLKDYREREANRALQPDLSALMMASDAWGGTKFLPSYKPPTNDEEKSARIAGADQMVQKALGGITDDEIALLKTQLAGANMLGKSSQKTAANMTPFERAAQGEEGKAYAKTKENALKADEYLSLVDDANKSLDEYSKKSLGGTGPFATFGGLKKYTDQDTQDLEAKFRNINLKNMSQTFQGMSRAIDSDAERRAWESTQASLTNDEKVNKNILLGQKALGLKAKAEADAQQNWVTQYGNLDRYKSPVIGRVSAMMDPSGEMKLIPKDKIKAAEKQGYLTIDSFSKRMGTSSGKKEAPSAPSASPLSYEDPEKEKRYQEWKAQQK